MGDTRVEAREVITYQEGTLAVVSGAGEEEGAMSVAFFGRDGRLGNGAKKILIDPLTCPKVAKKVEDGVGHTFCIMSIEKSDMAKYGDVVGGIFRKAWEGRLALPKIVKPQAEGSCTIDVPPGPDTVSTTRFFDARFQQPFTLRTRTAAASQRYTAKDLERILRDAGEGVPVVDPARCMEAQSSFELSIDGAKQDIKMAISGRPFLHAPFYAGLPQALGLREIPELPRVALDGGRGTIHLNLKP